MDNSVSQVQANATFDSRRMRSDRVLLACGFSGILFISAFLILGAIAPGYSGLHDTISALELTTVSVAQRANFFIFGLLLSCFAIGLRRELVPGRGAFLIPLFQLVSAVGVIGDAIFIYEPMHLVCDLIAFNSALIGLFLFAWRFRREPAWKGWTAYSVVTALAMMGFLAAFGLANHFGGPAGLLEKLATCTRTMWSVGLTARLLSGKRFGRR